MTANDPMPAVRSILGMPPKAVDHKAEAEEILANLAAPANDPHGAALAHATLDLAEQMRIGNKLKVALIEQIGELARATSNAQYAMDPALEIQGFTPDEREGLGLS